MQSHQGVRSTQPKVPKVQQQQQQVPALPSKNDLHIIVEPISKLYTDDTGRFPSKARSGNQYLMIAFHSDTNAILVAPFKSRKDSHRMQAYNEIMQRLKAKNQHVDLQILDNEASAEYKKLMTETWKVAYQFVPPDNHRRNAAERAIRTFKAHFIAILAGIAPDFPRNLWDLLLPQTEMTLNLLRQSNSNPKISAWEAFNGVFSYNHTPLGPLGCRVLIHKKTGNRNSWDYRGAEGWGYGVAEYHYRCQKVISKATKATQVSDTVEFRHHHITQPSLTSDDRILHGVLTLTGALKKAPTVACDAQLRAIAELRNVLQGWSGEKDFTRAQPPSKLPPAALPRVHRQKLIKVAENLAALRDTPKEEGPRIALPIALPESTPSASPPRVQNQSPRVSPRSPVRQTKPEESPISTRTRHNLSKVTNLVPIPAPVVKPVVEQAENEPISRRTRYQLANLVNNITPQSAARRKYPRDFLLNWALPV